MMSCEGNKHIADGGREIARQLKYAFKAQWRCWRDKKCARAYRLNRHSRFPPEARRCRWCNWQLLLFARRNWFRGDYWFAVDFAGKTKNIIMREFSDVFARSLPLPHVSSRDWIGVFALEHVHFGVIGSSQSHHSLPHHRISRWRKKTTSRILFTNAFCDAQKFIHFPTSSAVAKLRLID